MNTRVAAVAALLLLGACSPDGQSGGEQGKFAGFEEQIPKWKTEIVASDPLCRSPEKDQRCEGFDVACKAERTLSADDTAKGITARVVAAMTWNGFDPKFRHAQSGVRAAEFIKGPSGWTRVEHSPVNMETCGDL
ncbi:MAG: hypothetical protein ACJ798_09960 [Phenylobacterium sp.]